MAAVRAAANRQKAWEDKLEDDAFLAATISPIVDGLVAMKPAVPYAMRQALRLMKKTIHFKDNTYGPGGAVGDPELSAQFAYLLRTNSYGLRGRNGHRHRGSTYGSQRTRSAMPLRVRKAFDVDSKLAQV